MTKRLLRIAIVLAVAVASAMSALAPAAAAALSAPERLRVSNVTATQISFHWSQNVSGFVGSFRARIFQNGTQVATTPLLNYTASGLVPGATYAFHVVAFDSAGNTSPPSRTITVTTRGPGVIPPGPTELRAVNVASARLDLAFEQPDDNWDISFYEVFEGDTRIAVVPSPFSFDDPTLTLFVRELTPEASHTYFARAIRASGASPSSNSVTVSTLSRTDLQAPTVPAGLTARAASYPCFSPRLTWTQSSDNSDAQSAIDYEILVNGARQYFARGTGTAVIDTVPVGTNTLAIRAVDSSGNASALATTTFIRKATCTDED